MKAKHIIVKPHVDGYCDHQLIADAKGFCCAHCGKRFRCVRKGKRGGNTIYVQEPNHGFNAFE